MAAKATRRLTQKGKRPAVEVRQRVYLTFPQDLVKEPIIYELGHQLAVITNIRGANISDTIGLVALEIDGTRAEVERAIEWLRERGVKVEPIEKNVIE